MSEVDCKFTKEGCNSLYRVFGEDMEYWLQELLSIFGKDSLTSTTAKLIITDWLKEQNTINSVFLSNNLLSDTFSILQFSGSGNGSGYGNGSGNGSGYGSGNGSGYGNGSGSGRGGRGGSGYDTLNSYSSVFSLGEIFMPQSGDYVCVRSYYQGVIWGYLDFASGSDCRILEPRQQYDWNNENALTLMDLVMQSPNVTKPRLSRPGIELDMKEVCGIYKVPSELIEEFRKYPHS